MNTVFSRERYYDPGAIIQKTGADSHGAIRTNTNFRIMVINSSLGGFSSLRGFAAHNAGWFFIIGLAIMALYNSPGFLD
jgi:hypothetical protein